MDAAAAAAAAAEKMAALKKVYADIILNMAKESAGRVIAAERRALAAQQGLAAAKDEAVAMLLRVKSTMDAQIREAENSSLGKQRKIEELESQLNVAEDTICFLRTELKSVNNELAKMKNNVEELLTEQNINCHETTRLTKCQERKHRSDSVLCSQHGHKITSDSNTTSSTRTSEGHPCSVEHAIIAESIRQLSAENESVSKPDLTSIIMRSKEPELYRNGCTQRIRALEQNVLTAKVPLGQSEDRSLNLKSASVICESGEVKRPCSINSVMADKMLEGSESGEILKHSSIFGNGQVVRFPRKIPRKRRGRRNYTKPINCRTIPDQDSADHKPSETVSCGRPEERKIFPCTSFRQGSPWLLQCSKATVSTEHVSWKSHSDRKNPSLESLPSHSETTRCRNSVGYPLSSDNKDDPVTGHAQNNAGNTPQEQVSTLITPDEQITENSDSLLHKSNHETGAVPIIKSDIKNEKECVSSGSGTAQPGRFLKYTFQRKRKRVPAKSKDDNSVLEENSDFKRPGDRQKPLREPQKPSLVMELPRKDRQLVQVARQLILLSERRW